MKKEATVLHIKRKGIPQLAFVALFAAIWQGSIARAADEPPAGESQNAEKSIWQTIRGKVRMRTFTEFMTPAIDNHSNYIPYEDGSKLLPTNTFNVVWVDYEIAPDTKILYYQRFNQNYADTATAQGISTIFRNPRFALRKLNVFKVPNLTTTYDLYIQPGLAPEADGAGRNFEVGFRTATSYSIPKSKWTIGATSELTMAFSTKTAPEGSSSLYGWLLSWASYDLTKTFSTQHYITTSIQHVRGTYGLSPDYPMPLNMQNGIGINVTDKIWAAVLINNYLNTLPTLSNTWASLWLSLNVL